MWLIYHLISSCWVKTGLHNKNHFISIPRREGIIQTVRITNWQCRGREGWKRSTRHSRDTTTLVIEDSRNNFVSLRVPNQLNSLPQATRQKQSNWQQSNLWWHKASLDAMKLCIMLSNAHLFASLGGQISLILKHHDSSD